MVQPSHSSRPAGWYRSGATRKPPLPPAAPLTESAWMIVSHLATGIGVYAFIGWIVSLLVGHQAVLVAVGALIGLALSLYLIIKRISAAGQKEEVTRVG